MYDIAIIGAGPSGATLARLIGKRYRVLLIDKRDFAEPTESKPYGKCCGGLLAPDAQRMLSKLGLGLPRHVLEEPQVFVVKAMDLQQGITRYYQRHYINMNRQRFDGWLLSLVPPEVDVRRGCRLQSYTAEKEYFRLKIEAVGKTFAEKTRILVGADGAISKVRLQSADKTRAPKKYFAIQDWVEGDHQTPHFTSLFDREITDYYCWTIPKGDCLIVGAALQPGSGMTDRFERLKRKLKACGFEFGKTLFREGTYVLRPVSTGQLYTGKDGIALLGEAAGWISPSSAEGFSYAFKSALMLAQALKPSPEGFEKRYNRYSRKLRRNIFFKNLKSRFIFKPRLRKAVMRSGLQSMKMVLPEE
jgi:flavin-dependent dehydrogenase